MKVAVALDTGENSDVWGCTGKYFLIHLAGDFDANTATLQCSPDLGTTWYDYRADDASGTPATLTWTATEVTDTDELFVSLVVAHGFQYRLAITGAGTSAINAWVTGGLVFDKTNE